MLNNIRRLSAILLISMITMFHSVASANYIGLPDFDWPHYWEDHENDDTVTCAHVAVANALAYWDTKFPDLIPDSYGSPETTIFHGVDGDTKLTSFWDLMTELTKEDYLGSGYVNTVEIGKGIKAWFKKQGVGLSYHSTTGLEFTEKWDFAKTMFDKGEVPIILLQGSYDHWVTGYGYDDNKSLTIFDPNKIGNGAQKYDLTKKDDGWYIHYDGHDARIWSVQAVTATPEPATMLLFGTGIVAIVGSSIRKKKKQ